MKPRRGLLIALGVVVAVLLLVLVLAFSSSVQTWAARRVLATQPDLAGEIGRVDVGLSYVRTENVVLRRPDMILTLPSLEADLSVLGAARERIEVRRLVAKGWTLDLTLGGATAHPAAVAAAPAAAFVPASSPAPAVDTNAVSLPVGDLLAALQLPVDIVAIDGVELEGQVFFLTGPNASRGRATVTITGGGLRPGQEGTFRVRSVAQLEDPAGPVSSLTLQSQLTLAMASPRRLSGATSTSTIEAAGGILAAPTQLHFDFAAGALSAGSVYSVQLRTPEKQLLRLEADPTPGTTDQLSGEWKLALTDRDVAPFALGYPLPHFNASGGGAVQLSTADGGVGLTGDISVDTSQLEVLLPELSAVGRTTSNLGFEARWVHDDVRVTRFHLQVAGERPVAEIVSRQGLELNLASREFRVADPEADLVEIKVHGVPLNWAQPFLGELTLTGGPLQGAWMAAAREGGFVLRAISPTQVGALQMTMHGETLVTALDVAMSPSFEYGPGGWQARVDRGQVQTGLQRFLSFEARAGQAAAKGAALVATARFTADLGGLLAQPGAEPYRVLQAGRLDGDAIVAVTDKLEAAAKIDFLGLVAPTGETLPRVTLDARADRAADGRIEAHVPVRVTQNGRASDVTLDAQLHPAGDAIHVDALVAGQHVFIQDLQLLGLPLAALTSEAPATPDAPTEGPVWSGVEGKLNFTFGTVVYSPELTATNVTGEVVLGADALKVPELRAALNTGGEVTFTGQLGYEAATDAPYRLAGDVAANAIDVGQLMRAMSPGATPPVEGKFDLTTKLHGRATDPSQLADTTAADVKLSSRGGTLRALSVSVAEYARTGSALANVAGLIGSITGDSRTQRYADRFKAATELTQRLAELTFDQLNIDVVRKPGEELTIKDLSLISPTIRLLGSGSLGDTPGLSLWEEAFQMRLQLSAREGIAANLKTLKLLSETADTLGYLPMLEDFRLDGTLSKVGTAQLQSLLSRALSSP